jgi:hypothetical protein
MRTAARSMGRPDAAQMIVETLIEDEAHEPVAISRDDQKRMAALVEEGLTATRNAGERSDAVALYDTETGRMFGSISRDELGFLQENLEQDGPFDDDYYINHATIDLLRERGAVEPLLQLLIEALDDREEIDVRWVLC